jgi:hypothetical protein
VLLQLPSPPQPDMVLLDQQLDADQDQSLKRNELFKYVLEQASKGLSANLLHNRNCCWCDQS